MASLVADKHGNYLVAFRWGGRQFTRSLDTRERTIAQAAVARVEETLMRLKRGWVAMPDRAEPGTFIVSGGTLSERADAAPGSPAPSPPPITVSRLFELYVEFLPPGRKEANTLLTERIHRSHIVRILGGGTPVSSISLSAAQGYAAARSRDVWRGRPIGPDTVRKELKTLRHVWAWGHALGHVDAACPWALKDLRLGKDSSREPFRTMEEIERRIARGGLGEEEQSRLWESLYLTGREVESVLDYARDHASARFVRPMIEFCALTGARRSELCRARVDDFDLENRTVHIRERKRVHSRRETTRVVDLHERLAGVMRAWFEVHPGGQFALAQDDGAPVSVSLATDHLRRTLADNRRWRLVPGFHTLRHSFASILAGRGVDQRVIDAFMGHQTPEMRARYQHLFPKALRRAIDELLA